LLIYDALAAPLPSHWSTPDSQTASDIRALACPSTHVCYATANQGTIVGATDGGRTWTALPSGAASGVWGLTCPSVTTCIAGSESLFYILRTTDRSRAWDLVYQPDPASTDGEDGSGIGLIYYHLGLYAATCPTVRTCLLVGTVGHVYRTKDDGADWTVQAGEYSTAPQAVGTSRDAVLSDVSCPVAGTCYTVGFLCNCSPPYNVITGGEIAVSTDGGGSWRSHTIANVLQGVACLDARTCVAASFNGTILRTTDGGRTWPAVPNPFAGSKTNLYAVARAGGVCRVVGGGADNKGASYCAARMGGGLGGARPYPPRLVWTLSLAHGPISASLGGAGGTLLVGS